MSYKHLFSRSFSATPNSLHLAAHSHHLWPDASYDGQMECWNDAASLADRKWDRVMLAVWPEAQAEVAAELGTGDPSAIVFAANTHDFIIRLAAACPRADPSKLRVLTSDGEFHSARRQFARWAEDGWLEWDTVPADGVLAAAQAGKYDLIMVSQVQFGTGQIVAVDDLAALGRPEGPWAVIDGYHSFMALDRPFRQPAATSAFYVAGGYKYAMAGEGLGLMHCPPGFGPRPPITGWYAEFGELTAPPGGVGYTSDAMRFMGATFDPSALSRFVAIRRMLAAEGLTTTTITAHVAALQSQLLDSTRDTALADADLLNPLDANPLDGAPHARFLAFRSPRAADWQKQLMAANCITDVRGDVLRIGLGLYHDPADIAAFAQLAASL